MKDFPCIPAKAPSLRMLIQRQWKDPSAVELTMHDVRRLRIDMFGDWIDGVIPSQEGEEPLEFGEHRRRIPIPGIPIRQ